MNHLIHSKETLIRVFNLDSYYRLIIYFKSLELKYLNHKFYLNVIYWNSERNYTKLININYVDFLTKNLEYFINSYEIKTNYLTDEYYQI